MLYQESILSQIKDSFLEALASVLWNALHPGSTADMDTTGGRADSTASFSPASPSAVACLVGQVLIFLIASLNFLAYVETCKSFNFHLFLNIPN